MSMGLVTIVGETQAKIGNRFYFMGPLTDCKECKLKNVCFNMEVGALYEVVGLRDTMHDCVARESKVRVVDVEKKAFRAAISKKQAMGSSVTFEKRYCKNIGCENWQLCCPHNVKNGDKLTIVDDISDIQCPIGEQLRLVKLE